MKLCCVKGVENVAIYSRIKSPSLRIEIFGVLKWKSMESLTEKSKVFHVREKCPSLRIRIFGVLNRKSIESLKWKSKVWNVR